MDRSPLANVCWQTVQLQTGSEWNNDAVQLMKRGCYDGAGLLLGSALRSTRAALLNCKQEEELSCSTPGIKEQHTPGTTPAQHQENFSSCPVGDLFSCDDQSCVPVAVLPGIYCNPITIHHLSFSNETVLSDCAEASACIILNLAMLEQVKACQDTNKNMLASHDRSRQLYEYALELLRGIEFCDPVYVLAAFNNLAVAHRQLGNETTAREIRVRLLTCLLCTCDRQQDQRYTSFIMDTFFPFVADLILPAQIVTAAAA